MCAGQTRHVVNGKPLTLRQGELLMLGQNARQSIEPAGERDLAVNIIVRPAFFSGTLPYLGEEETPLRSFIVSCLTGKNEAGYLLFHVSEILPIQNLIENLLYTIMEDTPNRRSILQMTMGLLFAQLMNHTEALQFETQEQNAVVSVLRYIEEHYRDGSLTEIAEALHYELPSLSRLIRRTMAALRAVSRSFRSPVRRAMSGTASSAAALGVGARRAATKSAIVKSVS